MIDTNTLIKDEDNVANTSNVASMKKRQYRQKFN